MKNIIHKYFRCLAMSLGLLLVLSCSEDFLEEIPLDRFSPENLLVDQAGFETAVVAMYQASRQEHTIGGANFDYLNLGTDLIEWGRYDSRGFKDYTLLNSQHDAVEGYWSWAYTEMIRQCNLILDNLENPDLEMDPEVKISFSSQAKFFRAYTYNILANLYGGVPIVENQITEPKFDFQRASKREVLEFIVRDLGEAAEGLPVVGNESN